MSSFESRMDRWGRALHELAHGAQDKLEQAVEVGSHKIDLLSLRRAVERETRTLGEIALAHLRAGMAATLGEDPLAQAAVERLTGLEEQIRRLELEVEAARRGRASAATGSTSHSPSGAGAAHAGPTSEQGEQA